MGVYDPNKPNFYDPSVLSVDQTLMQAPRSLEVPTGFGDRVKAAFSDNLVFGMQPDEFAMFLGSLGASMLPENHPISRFGQTVAGFGAMRREQRLKEAEPERRYQEAKTRAILGEGAPAPGTRAPVAGVQPTSLTLQDPMSMAAREGEYAQAVRGELVNKLTAAQIDKEVAEAERLKTTLPYDIRHTQALTTKAEVEADVATATKDAMIQRAQAELEQARAQAQLYNQQSKYFKTTHVDIPTQQLAQGWGHLALEREQLKESIAMRRTQELTNMNNKMAGFTAAINERLQKQLTDALPNQTPGLFAAAGSNLISEGLKHIPMAKNFADVDPTESSKAVAAEAISAGINHYVSGINAAKNIKDKITHTQQLLGQLDLIRKVQPEMANALEMELFGSGSSPLQKSSVSRWFRPDEVFDPATVWKMYRGQK